MRLRIRHLPRDVDAVSLRTPHDATPVVELLGLEPRFVILGDDHDRFRSRSRAMRAVHDCEDMVNLRIPTRVDHHIGIMTEHTT